MNDHQPIQMLQGLSAELSRVAAAEQARGRIGSRARLRGVTPRPGAGRRVVALTVAAVVALSGVAYAVPATRDAVDGITSSLAGWMAGDDSQAPGRALRPGDAPDWVHAKDGRVIAEGHGIKVVVTRLETDAHETMLSISLNSAVPGAAAFASTLEGWGERFAASPVAILGTAPLAKDDYADDAGRVPLVGVTARSVDRVELRYATGPPLVAEDLDGGVVLMADAARLPREVIAYDAAGRELGRESVSQIDVRDVCERDGACAPLD
jgi:hypothetical protein